MMNKILAVLVSLMLFSTPVLAFDAEYLLNSANLRPTHTGFAPCDQLVQTTLNQITDSQMSTYDKVKACYDYLIENCSYGRKNVSYNIDNGYLLLDNQRIPMPNFFQMQGPLYAYEMLQRHVGVCDDYSCAFAAMVRAIGLDCYTIGGQTARASRGMTGHVWCVIKINDTEYIFDPQIDDNIAKGGEIGYYRFCKTYSEVPDSYVATGINDYFRPF